MVKRAWLLRLCVLTIVAAIMIGAVLMVSLKSTSLESLQSSIADTRTQTTAIRLTIIGLIALIWPKLVQHTERSGAISIERSAELRDLRWRIISWLLVIELLLGQNLIWRVFQIWDGGGACVSRATLNSLHHCLAGPSMASSGMCWWEPASCTCRSSASSLITGASLLRVVNLELSQACRSGGWKLSSLSRCSWWYSLDNRPN